jgi:DNA-binding response OmpR family regulator
MENIRILVIEDDEALRQMLTTALRGAGYQVSEAANGREGLCVFQQSAADLVITDIFMPEEDGIETIFELKATAPTVKVIAISGGGRWAQYGRKIGADEPLELARHFGADRILKKPVKLQHLLEIVKDLVQVMPPPKSPQPASSQTSSPVLDVTQQRKRVLIIEDDDQQRQLFKTTLSNAGYEVFEAPDGQSGLQAQTDHNCDLIITDIFMPKRDGIEMLFGLKTQFPHVKVIAISGGGYWTEYGNQQTPEEPLHMALRIGADRTLKKPVKLRQLVALADELLRVKGRLL